MEKIHGNHLKLTLVNNVQSATAKEIRTSQNDLQRIYESSKIKADLPRHCRRLFLDVSHTENKQKGFGTYIQQKMVERTIQIGIE